MSEGATMDWTTEIDQEDRPERDEPVAPHQSRLKALTVTVVLVLVLAVGGTGFVLGHYVLKSPAPLSTSPQIANSHFPFGGNGGYRPPSPPLSGGTATSTGGAAAAKIATSVDPGVVDINTTLSYQGATASGTGMILSSNGLVLTNNHVIEGATSITARDVATNTVYKAKVVGYDVTGDVALLQLQNATGLTTVSLGDSSKVTAGEKVVGIGNALGVGGTPNYAGGSVVALDQSVTASDNGSPTGSETLTGMFEVSAAIQPGDSGGPLVNTKGVVLAMDTAGSSSSGGSGFDPSGSTSTRAYAIPIDSALSIVKSIESNSSSSVHVGATAFLGVEVTTYPSLQQGYEGGSQSQVSGAEVVSTIPGTPAAKSALVPGDVITSLNGTTISTVSGLGHYVQGLHPGNSVQVGYVTLSGTQSTLTLQLASGPPQ
jgi:S1-C subfamily serine protease